MNTKTMEGLVGASTNMKNMDTPIGYLEMPGEGYTKTERGAGEAERA